MPSSRSLPRESDAPVCLNCQRPFTPKFVNEDGIGGRARRDGIGASYCSRACMLQAGYAKDLAEADAPSGTVVPIHRRLYAR